MAGGMHGAFDEKGALVEKGWIACGFEQAVDAAQDRTWAALERP